MEDWKEDLRKFLEEKEMPEREERKREAKRRKEIKNFHLNVVRPALEELKNELEKNRWNVDIKIEKKEKSSSITEYHSHKRDFRDSSMYFFYSVRGGPNRVTITIQDFRDRRRKKGTKLRMHHLDKDTPISKKDIIQDFLKEYKKFVNEIYRDLERTEKELKEKSKKEKQR